MSLVHVLPEDIFPNTNIRGGVCYFLWDSKYDNKESLTRVVTHQHNEVVSDVIRPMKIGDVDIFIRDYRANAILMKVFNHEKSLKKDKWLMEYVSPRKPFGLSGNFTKDAKFNENSNGMQEPVKCYGKNAIGYVERNYIKTKNDWIDKWKIFTAYANNIGTELNDDNSAVLNDYNADELNSLLQQLLIQIFSVNAQKIQSAYNF